MGRPRKEETQPEGTVSTQSESDIVNEIRKDLKVKVVSVADYINKARELFGPDNVWEDAVGLLYSENEVIAVLDKKGEQRFVCKR